MVSTRQSSNMGGGSGVSVGEGVCEPGPSRRHSSQVQSGVAHSAPTSVSQPPARVLTLQDMPMEIMDKICSNLNYNTVAHMRPVSRRMDRICGSILNSSFQKLQAQMLSRFQAIKAQMPRRESARRNHPLACESDIIETLHMRLTLLQMSFGKHIERKHCCFFPGEILDEVNRILHYIKITPKLARPYKVTDELFDLSTMAMEYFKERIEPKLPEIPYFGADFLDLAGTFSLRSPTFYDPMFYEPTVCLPPTSGRNYLSPLTSRPELSSASFLEHSKIRRRGGRRKKSRTSHRRESGGRGKYTRGRSLGSDLLKRERFHCNWSLITASSSVNKPFMCIDSSPMSLSGGKSGSANDDGASPPHSSDDQALLEVNMPSPQSNIAVRRRLRRIKQGMKKYNTQLMMLRRDLRGCRTKIAEQQKQIVEYANRLDDHDKKNEETSRKFSTLLQELNKCKTELQYWRSKSPAIPVCGGCGLSMPVPTDANQGVMPEAFGEALNFIPIGGAESPTESAPPGSVKQEPGATSVKQEPSATSVKQESGVIGIKQETAGTASVKQESLPMIMAPPKAPVSSVSSKRKASSEDQQTQQQSNDAAKKPRRTAKSRQAKRSKI